MTKIYTKKELKIRRKILRHNMTVEENILWTKIRKKQIGGFRFLRQFSVNMYVIDFYCPALKLAIEIDGTSHDSLDDKEYDAIRQSEIEQLKIEFMRFKNNEVLNDLDSVIQRIRQKVKEKENPPQSPL